MKTSMFFKLSLLIDLVLLTKHRSLSQPSTDICSNYDAAANKQSSGQTVNCLPRLSDPVSTSDYDVCKTKTCFLFIRSSPVISFDTTVFNSTATRLQRPFRCSEPESLHGSLGGIAFLIHKRIYLENDTVYCIWSGPECTFNALVDYTAVMAEKGYRFAITGLLLDMPQRRCEHIPSAPILDNPVVIIGRRDGASQGPLQQLIRPFRLESWCIIAVILSMFLIICVVTVVKMNLITKGNGLEAAWHLFNGENALPIYDVDAENHGKRKVSRHVRFIHANGALLRVRSGGPLLRRVKRDSNVKRFGTYRADEEDQFLTRIARYRLAMTMFRIALTAFLCVFALFYEVAVVNFLFQQGSVKLSKSVQLLSREELSGFAVLKTSALEVVWNHVVSRSGRQYNLSDESDVPWRRCSEGQDCIRWVADDSNDVQYSVTYETKGQYLIQREVSCEKLAVIETKDVLYHFSGGWLYSRAVAREVREQIDRGIVLLRMTGELEELFKSVTGDISCDPVLKPDIGPLIILIPCGLLVFPFLIGSLLMLTFWGRKKKEFDGFVESENGSQGTSSESLQNNLSSDFSEASSVQKSGV